MKSKATNKGNLSLNPNAVLHANSSSEKSAKKTVVNNLKESEEKTPNTGCKKLYDKNVDGASNNHADKPVDLRKAIIKESIACLDRDGLKFSIDVLCERLKISKKTVYKFFETKEELAREIYAVYYAELDRDLSACVESESVFGADKLYCLLELYLRSAKMNRDEIFNKFNLNSAIKEDASSRHAALWRRIEKNLCEAMSEQEAAAYRIVADGSLWNLMRAEELTESVLALLVRLIFQS